MSLAEIIRDVKLLPREEREQVRAVLDELALSAERPGLEPSPNAKYPLKGALDDRLRTQGDASMREPVGLGDALPQLTTDEREELIARTLATVGVPMVYTPEFAPGAAAELMRVLEEHRRLHPEVSEG